jgi:hypothetical protein
MARKSKAQRDREFALLVGERLHAHGYDIELTGRNDKAMQTALKDFQRRYGLRVTGTGTEKTWGLLKREPDALPAPKDTTVPMPRVAPHSDRPAVEALTGADLDAAAAATAGGVLHPSVGARPDPTGGGPRLEGNLVSSAAPVVQTPDAIAGAGPADAVETVPDDAVAQSSDTVAEAVSDTVATPVPAGLAGPAPDATAYPVPDSRTAVSELPAPVDPTTGNSPLALVDAYRYDDPPPPAWPYLSRAVEGISDKRPPQDMDVPDGWWVDHFDAVERDRQLDDLVRPGFDEAARRDPVVEANGKRIGDVWRTMRAWSQQTQAEAARGTVGLPGGKEYGSVGEMAVDYGRGALDAVKRGARYIGESIVTPAEGAEAPAPAPGQGPQPSGGMTDQETLQYLMGEDSVAGRTPRIVPLKEPGPLDAAWRTMRPLIVGTARTAGEIMSFVPLVGGVRDAMQEALEAVDSLGDWLGEVTGLNVTPLGALRYVAGLDVEGNRVTPDETGFGTLPEMPEQKTAIGQMERSITGFLTTGVW